MRSGWAAAAAALLLAGCVTEESLTGKVDYKSTVTLPSLEVPPDLTSPARDNRYVIPETGRSSATFSGYQAERRDQRNPGTTPVLPEFDKLRIERAGTQRWLVVDDSPEKLWPVIKDFWQENGFLVKLEVPEAGVMETDWAENRANIPQGGVRYLLGSFLDQIYSTSERDKFRTRLDRIADGKSTEVYISHRGMQEVYTTMRDPQSNAPGGTAWQPRPADPDLEAEFLRRLMVRLGAQDEKARALMASSAPLPQAELKKVAEGVDTLGLVEPFDRAWRRVGLALDRVGFTVEDRDRQKGLYFVRYADPESEMALKDRGFIDRLFGSGPKTKPEQYRVQLQSVGQGTEVTILNKDGAADRSSTARRILSLLLEQLK
ncbi:MAG TPA: outer membrane protein assembly factor BamC [Burkholderiales bacterium]|nr:outer membrane protein assembly factor BamC [Burkholderiales bacterium]